jgi:hypothetical protein
VHTAETLEALVTDHLPESQVLEYKGDQVLDSREQKSELLKDLTGMGNGGGGTILIGVAEDDDHLTAKELAPLSDPALKGRIENVARAGVQPPLLYELRRIDVEGGFVLEATVEASPLGPYMVTLYSATEGRYYKRHQTSVDQMSEAEIRDAYALAQRAGERRPVLWEEHGLPLVVGGAPQLCVAALPFEPLREILDLRHVAVRDVTPPPDLVAFINFSSDVADAIAAGVLWAQGFVGRSTRTNTHVRLHRDGACAISQALVETVRPTDAARIADAIFAYLGWLWQTFDLRRPVELRASVENIDALTLLVDRPGGGGGRTVVKPIGMQVLRAGDSRQVEPWELASASARHRVVQLFVDSLVQAYGMPHAEVPFSAGFLYGPSGALSITLEPDRAMIWSHTGNRQLGRLEPSGAVLSCRSGAHVGHVDGGVIVDLEGDTLAVTELGTGPGYPENFFPNPRATTELFEATTRSSAINTPGLPSPPIPTGQWGSRDLEVVLDDLPA